MSNNSDESLTRYKVTRDKTEKLPRGLLVVGCDHACGKTVLMTGLAGVLDEQGAPVRAIKPISLGGGLASKAELSFISSVSNTPLDYPRLALEFPPTIKEELWSKAIFSVVRSDDFTIAELPGNATTPVDFEVNSNNQFNYTWKNTTDLALEIGFPVLLVARHSVDAIERIDITFSYLKSREVDILALATVQTNERDAQTTGRQIPLSDFELLLSTRTRCAYLGCLPFSPSISVPRGNQGNIRKLTSESLDLLVLRRCLDLPV